MQSWQYVLKVVVWRHAQQVARAYEGHVYGCVPCRLVAVDEEPVLASEGDGPDAALNGIVVYLVVALVAVAAQAAPSFERVVAGPGQCACRCVSGSVLLKHQPDEAEYGHGLLLPLAAYLIVVGTGILEVGLQLVEGGDVLQDVPRLGRGVTDLLELAPGMGHAVEGHDALHL